MPDRRKRANEGNQPLPDWLGGKESGDAESALSSPQKQPITAATPSVSVPVSTLAQAQLPLENPVCK